MQHVQCNAKLIFRRLGTVFDDKVVTAVAIPWQLRGSTRAYVTLTGKYRAEISKSSNFATSLALFTAVEPRS